MMRDSWRKGLTCKKEVIIRHAEQVIRLTAVVARHKAAGNYELAAVFTELLIEAQERAAADRLTKDDHYRRDVFTSKLIHELRGETHVIVGDHSPEPRSEGLAPEPRA